MAEKLIIEDLLKKFNDIHKGYYDYNEVIYVNKRTKIKIICPKHGVFYQLPLGHLKCGCNKCTERKTKLTNHEVIQRFINTHGNEYDYSRVNYINAKTKVEISCKLHGSFYKRMDAHIRGEGCRTCLQNKIDENTKLPIALKHHISKTDFINSLDADFSSNYDYSLLPDYFLRSNKIPIICQLHGKFEQRASDHQRRFRCSKCRGISSHAEAEIINFIQEYIPTLKIIQNDRTILKGKELDIYIPSKKLAIEYCGIYWHSEKFKPNKNYHFEKYKTCRDKDIKLITIFEDEWIEHKDIIKNLLLSKLELSNDYMDNVSIENISINDKKKFFDLHHIQGNGPSSLNYGIYNHDRIMIAAMGFICNDNGNFVLNRYAESQPSLFNFEKLFSHFKQYNNYENITIFTDNRWGNEDIYLNNNWVQEKMLNPTYSYVKDKKRYHKSIFKKNKITSNEYLKYNSQINDFLRIWDCGKIKYKYVRT